MLSIGPPLKHCCLWDVDQLYVERFTQYTWDPEICKLGKKEPHHMMWRAAKNRERRRKNGGGERGEKEQRRKKRKSKSEEKKKREEKRERRNRKTSPKEVRIRKARPKKNIAYLGRSPAASCQRVHLLQRLNLRKVTTPKGSRRERKRPHRSEAE
jgi:hypothetical protein